MDAVAALTITTGNPVSLLMPVGRFAIGRSLPNDLLLTHKSVSRQEAILLVEFRKASLTDQDSRNGTFVNEQRIKRCELQHGVQVRFGDVECNFEWLEEINADEDSTHESDEGKRDRNKPLSKAEERVLFLLLSGHTEKEIATNLSLSRHTIHNHTKRIYRAFGVHSRADLMTKFISSQHKR